MEHMKKQYSKPSLKLHGSVEALTGYTGGHDIFKGGFLNPSCKTKSSSHGPADKMS